MNVDADITHLAHLLARIDQGVRTSGRTPERRAPPLKCSQCGQEGHLYPACEERDSTVPGVNAVQALRILKESLRIITVKDAEITALRAEIATLKEQLGAPRTGGRVRLLEDVRQQLRGIE